MTHKEHPSYGMIHFSRVTGGNPTLFGSNIKNNDSIELVISNGEVCREINRSWYHSKNELIRVRMSQAQFATLITSLNCSPVPCTLEYVNGKRMPPVPKEDETATLKEEFSHLQGNIYESAMELTKKAKTYFEPGHGTLKAAEKKELLALLKHIEQEIGSNMDYVAGTFNEFVENVTTEAKAEIELFYQNRLHELANAAAATSLPNKQNSFIAEEGEE